MQIATWNVNSLSVRLPQVLAWLQANPVDALALQELKLTDDKFPLQALQEARYHAVSHGQKTFNGVARRTGPPSASRVAGMQRARSSSRPGILRTPVPTGGGLRQATPVP